MKLLFDHNLSPVLCDMLSDIYPDSRHVMHLGMDREDDMVIWNYAAENEFTIASKDNDFHQLAFVKGPPPKVIWIQRGNCATRDIADLLRRYHSEILGFSDDAESAFLALR